MIDWSTYLLLIKQFNACFLINTANVLSQFYFSNLNQLEFISLKIDFILCYVAVFQLFNWLLFNLKQFRFIINKIIFGLILPYWKAIKNLEVSFSTFQNQPYWKFLFFSKIIPKKFVNLEFSDFICFSIRSSGRALGVSRQDFPRWFKSILDLE